MLKHLDHSKSGAQIFPNIWQGSLMHLFQAYSITVTALTKVWEQVKEADKTWKHYSSPQKRLNPQCAFPPSPKNNSQEHAVLYHDGRTWPTQSGYAISEASGKHSIIAGDFFNQTKTKQNHQLLGIKCSGKILNINTHTYNTERCRRERLRTLILFISKKHYYGFVFPWM